MFWEKMPGCLLLQCFYCCFQMLSRPPFTVEIKKGGEMSLAMHCIIPMPEQQMQDQGDEPYGKGKDAV